MKKIAIISIFLSVCSLHADDAQIGQKPPESKILAVSTAGPTIDYLLENYQTVEEMLPTDGMILFLDVPGFRDGNPTLTTRHNLFSNWQWEREWFEPSLASLKEIEFEKLTDNFIYVAVTGANYDMFDDAAWNKVYHNIAIINF